MSGATRRQDVMIRISGIFEFIDPNHLGFQESEVTLPPIAVGLQESGQEAGAARTDCRNLHFHRPRRSPFFWNPVPLMQNYMIKSVKMTKKASSVTNFHGKFVPLQRCFAKGTNYIAQLSTRTATSNEINEQTYIHGVCALGADSSIVCRGCRRPEWIYGRGLRFLNAFELVLSPQNLDERINNKYKIQ